MKIKTFPFRRLCSFFFVISASIVLSLPVIAQNSTDFKDSELLPPSEEKFQPDASDLVVPWRSNGCYVDINGAVEPGCHNVTEKESLSSDMLNLYNEDGTLWYGFSVQPKSPDYYFRDPKLGFLPFGTTPTTPTTIFLRMVGESPNWYEVEINEETHATKFVLKNEPMMWEKSKWSRWLMIINLLKFVGEQPQLRDKPDGQVIEESADAKFENVKFLKADGDWALVEGGVYQKTYQGWVRWRKGRDILVKDRYGAYNFAKPKVSIDNK